MIFSQFVGAENLMTDLHYMTSWEPGHKMRTHFMVAIWTLAPITLAVMFVLDSYKMIEMSWVGRFDDFDLTLWGVLFMWILCQVSITGCIFSVESSNNTSV